MGGVPGESAQHALEKLREEIETHIRALGHPVAAQDDAELFDLTAASWRLAVEYGKLTLEIWNSARSIVRRVEDVAYRDHDRLGLFVRRAGGRETETLELRNLHSAGRRDRGADRNLFLKKFLGALGRQFPGWKFERVSHRSDREFSLSARYARGLARRGTSAWAFLALAESESPEAADSALAFALIWLDWLRSHAERVTVSGLKLFLPPSAVELNAARARALDSRAFQLELFEYRAEEDSLEPVAAEAGADLGVHLVPRLAGERLLERHRDTLRALLGEWIERVAVVPDSAGMFLSVRVKGLEVARIEGDLAPRILYGLEGSVRDFRPGDEAALRAFVASAVERRRPDNPVRTDDFYRLQPERWLESLLVEDLTRLDSELSPVMVYPQVPAITRAGRGLIDILAVTRGGRLAVIELKLHEEINLPIQALDYWLRVRELNGHQALSSSGFFPGVALDPRAPLLYLVSPGLRFHSTTSCTLRYFDPAIEVRRVGIGSDWRNGIKVLFRKAGRAGL